MYTPDELVETFEMISLQHLNVRTVTLGINLLDCSGPCLNEVASKVKGKILKVAQNFVDEVQAVESKYGIPIVNKRIAVTPLAIILEPLVVGLPDAQATRVCVELAKTLDEAAKNVQVDFIGGYSALVQKGWTKGDFSLMNSIPDALSSTETVCSLVNIADTRSGINVDAALKMGEIISETASRTSSRNGLGCAKLVTFANAPEDNPFMPGAFHGLGQPENTVNVGISGPGVIRAVVEQHRDIDFRELADLIKRAAFKITSVGQLIGKEVAERLGVKFSAVDLSLAPTPEKGDSIANIIEAMGVESCGAPGTTAALALLTDAVKKGGSMASTFVGGLSGAFIPVSEDAGMVEAARKGSLTIEKLEAMTAVCSAGLDMITIPGDTSPETVAAIILDEMAICVLNNKAGGVRLIPVPGKKVGDYVEFGGLLGGSVIMPVSRFNSTQFVRRRGQIPSPISSLKG